MNSYSENLHASVVASLQSQELNQKQLDAQLNASMFTLYFAEGAEIVATNKLRTASEKYKKTQKIKAKAVNDKNISSNLLMSANQQKTFTTQSVTNVAVSASNIQIATNAIIRLASDMGSIFSIINAADYGTQIHQQSIEAYNLMNKTAYLAELASQHAMEASASIAEVASSSIADKAKLTDDSLNNLLNIANTDFVNMTAIVTADNDAKAAANVTAKIAEGTIEYSKVEFEAAKVAYKINNKRLNFDLRVNTPEIFDNSYAVSFDYYKSPFSVAEIVPDTPTLGLENPVKNYNVFLVKESKKSTFSISNAEELLTNPIQYVSYYPTNTSESEELITSKRKTITSNYDLYFDNLTKVTLLKNKNKEIIENANNTKEIHLATKKERINSDAAIVTSKNEVAKAHKELDHAKTKATLASEAVKKDPKNADFAKAATLAIKLQNTAETALENAKLIEHKAIDTARVALDNEKIAAENAENASKLASTSLVSLEEAEKALKEIKETAESSQRQGYFPIPMLDLLDSDNEVIALGEKYVVFLMIVFSDEYKKGINTYDDYLSAPSEAFSLKNTLNAVENSSIIEILPENENRNSNLPVLSPYSINFTPIKDKNPLYTEYRCMFLSYPESLLTKNELEDLEEIIEVSIVRKEMNTLKNAILQYDNEISLLSKKTAELEQELKGIKDSKDPLIVAKAVSTKNNLGKYTNAFNEVKLRNTIAQNELENLKMSLEKTLSKIKLPVKNDKAFFFNLNLAENIPSGNYSVAKPLDSDSSTYEVLIDLTTTDNFGNPLLDSTNYIPVILSYYNGPETTKKQYNNNLSDWENAATFKFSINNKL